MNDDNKSYFRLKMLAKVDELTDFQTAFSDMARFIAERNLSDEFLKYVEKHESGAPGSRVLNL